MWPFSTLKSLRLELAQAEESNDNLRRWCAGMKSERDTLAGEVSDLRAKVLRINEMCQETEGHRKRSEEARITLQESNEQHVRNEKDLNRVLGGRDAMCKALAAERDEAVLRARGMETKSIQQHLRADRLLGETISLKRQLQGAMVRDPKTGRLTKWVDRSSVTPPLVSKTPEMYA